MPDMHSTTQVERRQSGRNGYAYPALVPPDGVEPPDRLTAVVDRLRRFVSSPLRELVLAADESALLSHRREVTVAFLDLRGFTAFSEGAEPEDVMAVLRDYHRAVGRLVEDHGGMLERFAGDGIMAFFNDPVPVPDPQLRAVSLALAAQSAVAALAHRWRQHGAALSLGVGVSHGFATVGLIGTEDRWDYAAIGSVTNLASRLCGRAHAAETLVCERVMAAVEGHVCAELVGSMHLRGFRHPHRVFRMRGLAAEPDGPASRRG